MFSFLHATRGEECQGRGTEERSEEGEEETTEEEENHRSVHVKDTRVYGWGATSVSTGSDGFRLVLQLYADIIQRPNRRRRTMRIRRRII